MVSEEGEILRTQGEYIGNISGDYEFTGTADTFPPTNTEGVAFFNGTSEIRTEAGTLNLKEAGAIDTGSPGNFSDLQTIVGGTGDFAYAYGQIHLFGSIDVSRPKGRGSSEYKGVLCTSRADGQ